MGKPAGKYRETSKAARGGKIQVDFARDDSFHDLPNAMRSEFGGSTTNLEHSLSGASAKQDGTGHNKKDTFD